MFFWWWAACAVDGGPGEALLGERAPDFELEGADGQPVVLSQHEGDVVLIDMSGFT